MRNFIRELSVMFEPDGKPADLVLGRETDKDNEPKKEDTASESTTPAWLSQLKGGVDKTPFVHFETITDLANAYKKLVDTQANGGEPSSTPKSEDWDSFNGKLTYDDGENSVSNAFVEACKGAKVEPEKAKTLTDALNTAITKMREKEAQASKAQVEEINAKFVSEIWGKEAEANTHRAETTLKDIVGDNKDLMDAFSRSGFDKHPFTLFLLNAVGNKMAIHPTTGTHATQSGNGYQSKFHSFG